MTIHTRLEQAAFEPSAELSKLALDAAGDGALVSLVGIARAVGQAGEEVARLVLDHHPLLTARSLQDIACDAASRFAVSHVRVVHRCGDIAPGEPIVFAGAAAPHRRSAFEAVDYLMDRLKTEAVLWKREDGAAGRAWIEPTAQDYADRGRWE